MTLHFTLDLTQTASHRLGVQLEMGRSAWAAGSTTELFLPAWTPGSYLIRDYARHLEQFAAVDAATGAPIPWQKTTKNRFALELPAATEAVRVTYRIYGRDLSVRTSDFTADRAFWNGACVFLWPVAPRPGLDAAVEVALPAGWNLATQLPHEHVDGMVRLHAADLDQLIDGPCLAGPTQDHEFEVAGIRHRFVCDGLDGVALPDRLIPDTQRVIEEAAAIFGGELPYRSYDFLALFADVGRGGLEHTDSCVLLAPRTTFHPAKSYEDFAGLVAHELFHSWNGKRMRPANLWEIDYERENYTSLLWVVEGMTAYYDDHLCLRAGVLTPERYLEILAESITAMHRTPGRFVHPLSGASFDAWIKLYRPDESTRNSTQSYYRNGSLAALCFDLTIRAATDGARSLDDAIAELYRTTFGRQRGYTTEDVVACLTRAADRDMAGLVAQLIDGPFDPDLAAVLDPIGLRLVEVAGETAHIGVSLQARALTIVSVLDGGPAQRGGLSPGDEILAINGLRVRLDNWSSILKNTWREGEPLEVLLSRRGRIVERAVTPVPAPVETCRIERVAAASSQRTRLRSAWLWEE